MNRRYTAVLDPEADGRSIASVPGIPGCHAYGRTAAQAVRRVKAALRFYLKTRRKTRNGGGGSGTE